MMDTLRKYGKPPYKVALVHGGPGAAGEMTPVALELSNYCGVLEHIQTATTIAGQLEELKNIISVYGDSRVTLVGHSWGAMLGFIFASQNPALVKNLVMVGSGVFEDCYAGKIMETRLERLDPDEKKLLESLTSRLKTGGIEERDSIFEAMGRLIVKTDTFDALLLEDHEIECRYDIYLKVWEEALQLRHSRALLDFGREVQCPVLAVHGDYDPHPAIGVRGPLSTVLKNFRFVILNRCGHYPWREKAAKDLFYLLLLEEILN